METLSITSQKFSKCRKNEQLQRRRCERQGRIKSLFFRAFRVSAPQVTRVANSFPRAFKTRDLETPLSLGIFTFFFFCLFSAKEEEKNKLLKRSEELKAERVELEAKAKELSNAIMVSKHFCPLLHVNLKSNIKIGYSFTLQAHENLCCVPYKKTSNSVASVSRKK